MDPSSGPLPDPVTDNKIQDLMRLSNGEVMIKSERDKIKAEVVKLHIVSTDIFCMIWFREQGSR